MARKDHEQSELGVLGLADHIEPISSLSRYFGFSRSKLS